MSSKFHNKKVKYDGFIFDSQKECDRYIYLKQLQRQGAISSLTLQKKFKLTDSVYADKYGNIVPKGKGKCVLKASYYYCDFFYYNSYGDAIVEDVKGYKTDLYQLKKKVIADKYGILIKEI